MSADTSPIPVCQDRPRRLSSLLAPDSPFVLYRITPNGTVLVGADARTWTVTVWADQAPHPDDWSAACLILADLRARPLGQPEFIGEYDVWTVHANLGKARGYPMLTAMAQEFTR